ncbi:MAG: acyl-CoA dehydratase activase-related protein [Clostridia bacterium]|nr:acyl-CoA dehydratase activase-related protein [Clostridia bacterium]
MKTYRAGIDIGSTTVKLVVLGDGDEVLFGEYRRHHAHTQETLKNLLTEAKEVLGNCALRARITGSGAINLGKALGIGFVQEVVSVATALKHVAPETDVAIELGGEDAKIVYFTGGLEERMNGVCAGGTGSFIDQMAALLQTDAEGLNEAAKEHQKVYPIAARCGVFAKTDIQPLINEGATRADLAASVFQAVVNQTISGLACGKPIRGTVAFLGGPLHFLTELKAAFVRTLKLTDKTTVDPENSHLFAAMGAALEAKDGETVEVGALIEALGKGVAVNFEMPRLDPLFRDAAEYDAFLARHRRAVVTKEDIASYTGDCFLGIDAGSTTTKLALIGADGRLLYSFYRGNLGNPVETAKEAIKELHSRLPEGARIVRSCSTGYGEALLKAAFSLDEGVVETIAHCTAAAFFDPMVDCVLDIGGQDMKCIKLKNGTVDTILLNEACSSGCGSFIENFAVSLGHTAESFAKEALFAAAPVDLGTRCTVFMNSNVKQAQKEGAPVSDISAGLAYSVIKNALYKVIKLASPEDLGKHIVVQGGTFHNHAVLRAFEKIAGVDATCPDISGLMGAFGAALVARSHYAGQQTTMLGLSEIEGLAYKSVSVRCGGCSNNCMLTVNEFPGGRKHISGNRCERGAGNAQKGEKAPDLVKFKRERMFAYPALEEAEAPRGVIGIPRVLNIYENFPFWATFFRTLGFRVVLSPFSTRKLYERGMESIPSESECYPAKMSHGHVQWLIDQGVKTIFHPCVFYERQETKQAQNHYNCPIVVSYAENLKNNVEAIGSGSVRYIRPFIAFTSEKTAADRLVKTAAEEWNIPAREVRAAVHAAWEEQQRAKADIRAEGKKRLDEMVQKGGRGIVLAGRPYHIDPEINHGIPELIASYGLTVFTEDSLPYGEDPERPIRVVDQWVYHSRLYSAAEFVAQRDDLELIQLNSFGCGLDAVTTDQVSEILERSNKLYTLLKIDEVNNLGAVRIRVRSLLAAMDMRREKQIKAEPHSIRYERKEFTREMRDAGYTIIAPQMSPIHFEIVSPVCKKHGYNVVILDNDNREAIDTGLKFVNNDACFPSITVVGQIMQAVLSGKYDTDRLAVIMSQTGGCCRASNYVAFIRRALEKAGLGHIPVVSLNLNGMETNSGFKFTLGLAEDVIQGIVYGDLIMRCLYRVRPYELTPGSANALKQQWLDACIEELTGGKGRRGYRKMCRAIVESFDNLPIDETLRKPRVGVVGEILVKYMPLANNHLVEVLEREGAEAVVPDLMDFFNYCIYSNKYGAEFLGRKKLDALVADAGVGIIRLIRKAALDALNDSKRFEAPMPIAEIAENTRPILSIGNQYGEGWFLTGEMIELIQTGVPNIVCIQPFACLPNHVVGKGVIKKLKEAYPQANIAAVDYDPGASEVNQLNRIKLMLSTAKENLAKEQENK